jgi:hypothetical protein
MSCLGDHHLEPLRDATMPRPQCLSPTPYTSSSTCGHLPKHTPSLQILRTKTHKKKSLVPYSKHQLGLVERRLKEQVKKQGKHPICLYSPIETTKWKSKQLYLFLKGVYQ